MALFYLFCVYKQSDYPGETGIPCPCLHVFILHHGFGGTPVGKSQLWLGMLCCTVKMIPPSLPSPQLYSPKQSLSLPWKDTLTWSANEVESMLISSLSAVSLHICSHFILRNLSKSSRMTPGIDKQCRENAS